MSLKFYPDKCVGCMFCVRACPLGAISPKEKKIEIDYDLCNLCGACIEVCKPRALDKEEVKKEKKDLGDYKGIWIFAEQRKGTIQPVVYELINEGRKLSLKRGTYLACVFLGSKDRESCLGELKNRGVDKIFVIFHEKLRDYLPRVYCQGLAYLVEKYKPEILLAGATTLGRDLLARVAVKLNTGLTADCTGLDISDEGLLLQTRPAFGGNIMATIKTPSHRPQMATVRHKVFEEARITKNPNCRIIYEEPRESIFPADYEIIELIEQLKEKVNLQEAEVIVSGGRGVGGGKNFKLIFEFADALSAAVGASRAAVDSGWISYAHQVGQTGQTVSPKIYIAVGISGQIQHLVGMQSSKMIIAINKDPYAPIFRLADYGIVGDLFKIVPYIIKALKNR